VSAGNQVQACGLKGELLASCTSAGAALFGTWMSFVIGASVVAVVDC
jgi:hypothetical protein